MSGSISYLFYAIDKPLKKSQQAAVAKLSRRAFPTGRRVEFVYHVDDNPEDYANPEDAPGNPGSPPKGMNLNRLPTYLRLFSRMLLPSDER